MNHTVESQPVTDTQPAGALDKVTLRTHVIVPDAREYSLQHQRHHRAGQPCAWDRDGDDYAAYPPEEPFDGGGEVEVPGQAVEAAEEEAEKDGEEAPDVDVVEDGEHGAGGDAGEWIFLVAVGRYRDGVPLVGFVCRGLVIEHAS